MAITIPSGFTTILPATKSTNGKNEFAVAYRVTSRSSTYAIVQLNVYVHGLTSTAWRYAHDLKVKIWGFMLSTNSSGGVVSSDYENTFIVYYSGLDETKVATFNIQMNLPSGSISKSIPRISITDVDEPSSTAFLSVTAIASTLTIPAYSSPTPSYDPTPTPTPTPSYSISSTATSTKDSITLNVSGIPSRTSCTLRWYLDGVVVGTNTRSYNSTGTTASYTFTGLTPSTQYAVRCVMDVGSTASAQTTQTKTTGSETGVLQLTATSRAVIARVYNMGVSPSYPRTVTYKVYSSDTGYEATYTYNHVTSTELTHSFTGLSINTNFTVTATIKNGGTTLLTLSENAQTSDDYDEIPTATIVGIRQKPESTNVYVDWITDKNASGTIYTFETKTGAGSWTTAKTVTRSNSPTEVSITLSAGEANRAVSFRIKASNAFLSDRTTTSNEKSFTVIGEYSFTTAKVAGNPLVITAEEWNRMAGVVEAKAISYGLSLSINRVTAGDPISAATYNEMKNAINSMQGINIPDKKPGNPIKASDINALRTFLNRA